MQRHKQGGHVFCGRKEAGTSPGSRAGCGGCATPASGSGAAEALREPAPGTAGAGAGDWVPLVSSPGHSLPLREQRVLSVLGTTDGTKCFILGGGCAAQTKVILTCTNRRTCVLVGRWGVFVDYDGASSCLDTLRQLYL